MRILLFDFAALLVILTLITQIVVPLFFPKHFDLYWLFKKEKAPIEGEVKKENADLNIQNITANPFVAIEYNDFAIESHLIGLYNANNINAAAAIGKYFDVKESDIKSAIENYIPANNRSQMMQKGSNEIILDAYNANPSSMAVAITNFLQLDKKNKIMILGDMFELGDESLYEHKVLVDSLVDQKQALCFLIGKSFYANKISNENVQFFETFDLFAEYLKNYEFNSNTILIKGSRGMALERSLEYIS